MRTFLVPFCARFYIADIPVLHSDEVAKDFWKLVHNSYTSLGWSNFFYFFCYLAPLLQLLLSSAFQYDFGFGPRALPNCTSRLTLASRLRCGEFSGVLVNFQFNKSKLCFVSPVCHCLADNTGAAPTAHPQHHLASKIG